MFLSRNTVREYETKSIVNYYKQMLIFAATITKGNLVSKPGDTFSKFYKGHNKYILFYNIWKKYFLVFSY